MEEVKVEDKYFVDPVSNSGNSANANLNKEMDAVTFQFRGIILLQFNLFR